MSSICPLQITSNADALRKRGWCVVSSHRADVDCSRRSGVGRCVCQRKGTTACRDRDRLGLSSLLPPGPDAAGQSTEQITALGICHIRQPEKVNGSDLLAGSFLSLIRVLALLLCSPRLDCGDLGFAALITEAGWLRRRDSAVRSGRYIRSRCGVGFRYSAYANSAAFPMYPEGP